MMTWRALSGFAVIAVLGPPALGKASASRPVTEFSAGISEVNPAEPEKAFSGRIFVGREGLRVEYVRAGQSEVVIANFRERAVLWLKGSEHHYVPLEEDVRLTDIFDLPCAGFPRSRREGEETVALRPAVKWTCRGEEGEETLEWFDLKLNVRIRQETAAGKVTEMKDLREGPQPEHLFEIPAHYRDLEKGQPEQ